MANNRNERDEREVSFYFRSKTTNKKDRRAGIAHAIYMFIRKIFAYISNKL